jgi:plastocyanin
MKTSRLLALLPVLLSALLLPFLASLPAQAAGASVTVANMSFSPARVRIGLGESVTWTFQDPIAHTATSNQGFFDTGAASGGATRSVRFPSAGSFGYHCRIHPMMTGKVVVPMTATGSAQDGWTLRWLAGKNPQGRSYDVQMRRVGTKTWSLFRHHTTAATGRFDRSGSWQVRARTDKGAISSGWTPAMKLA